MRKTRLFARVVSLVLVALLTGPMTVPAKAQVGVAAQYVALLGVLQTLRSNLDAVINTVNQSTADRIRQVEIAVDNNASSAESVG